jgi:hypothetical protein
MSDLLKYAEEEMSSRDVPAALGSYSEARLGVWREVLGFVLEHLPKFRVVLDRVQQEYDAAIDSLCQDVRHAEVKVANAWAAQQGAEQATFVAKTARHDEFTRAKQQLHDELAEHKRTLEKDMEAKRKQQAVAAAFKSLGNPRQSSDAIADLFEQLGVKKRLDTLLQLARHLSIAERAALFQQLIHGRPDGALSGMKPKAEGYEAQIEEMLDALPERLRSDLGVKALSSLNPDAREAAFRAVRRKELLDQV